MTSGIALKEWAIVVEALAAGEQILLVRKGGIRDPKGAFQLQHREFLLYPTWEHQGEKTEGAIRPEFRQRYEGILRQPHAPAEVPLKVYGGVAFCGEIRAPDQMKGLEDYHIWSPGFFEERMKYRPQAPTLIVVLRAYRLPREIRHPIRPEYAGCKSWVPLSEEIPVESAVPAVDNRRFREALEKVSARLESK
ncbi:MAG: DUF1802 family protein [Candidatus Omnitrophica bacterium]|nr:DUF1802 family protein [Candidatus Omnitrophota bacterium]